MTTRTAAPSEPEGAAIAYRPCEPGDASVTPTASDTAGAPATHRPCKRGDASVTYTDTEAHRGSVMHAGATDRVEQELVILLRRVRARLQLLAREVHPDLDLAAYGLLPLIGDGEATTVTALAAQLEVGKPTVSRQVAALEALGLLRRTPIFGGDRRAVPFELTTEGLGRLDAARAHRAEQFRTILEAWSVDDLESFASSLDRFNRLPW